MGGSGLTFSSDDIVIKSPNDRRLYRVIQLENGLTALLVHDPQIYPDGPPDNSQPQDMDCEEEEEEDDDSDGDEADEGDYEEEEEEEEDEGESEKGKGEGGGASQTKKVS